MPSIEFVGCPSGVHRRSIGVHSPQSSQQRSESYHSGDRKLKHRHLACRDSFLKLAAIDRPSHLKPDRVNDHAVLVYRQHGPDSTVHTEAIYSDQPPEGELPNVHLVGLRPDNAGLNAPRARKPWACWSITITVVRARVVDRMLHDLGNRPSPHRARIEDVGE